MAINWEILKSQYLQASRTTQLDSLALNLKRIQVLARSDTDATVGQHLIRESQFFIEWLVPALDLDTDLSFAAELVDLQRLLSQWKLDWSKLWANETNRSQIAELSQRWCDIIHGKCEAVVG